LSKLAFLNLEKKPIKCVLKHFLAEKSPISF